VGRLGWGTVAVISAAGALVSLDTMVNIAFPAITASFGIEVGDIQWVVTTYVLTFASLLLAAGRLSDAFGHRRILAIGLVLSACGLARCGVAHEHGWFLMARVVQGVGAAVVMGSTPALVTLSVPATARDRALGIFQMGAALGLAIGPALGGILLAWTSWRAVHRLRVPVALVVVALVEGVVPAPSAGGRGVSRCCAQWRWPCRSRLRRGTAPPPPDPTDRSLTVFRHSVK
jgi:MFS family permease